MDISPQNLVVLLGSIDFVVIWKLILNRSLRAFHYTFLIVFVVSFVVIAHEVSMERFHPLGVLDRWYQHVTGEKTTGISLGFLWSGERGELWMACLLSFTLGCAIGLVAAWLEERRGWDIAAFLRGARWARDRKSLADRRSRGMGWGGTLVRALDREGRLGGLSGPGRLPGVISAEVEETRPRSSQRINCAVLGARPSLGRVAPGITPWSSHRSGRAR